MLKVVFIENAPTKFSFSNAVGGFKCCWWFLLRTLRLNFPYYICNLYAAWVLLFMYFKRWRWRWLSISSYVSLHEYFICWMPRSLSISSFVYCICILYTESGDRCPSLPEIYCLFILNAEGEYGCPSLPAFLCIGILFAECGDRCPSLPLFIAYVFYMLNVEITVHLCMWYFICWM